MTETQLLHAFIARVPHALPDTRVFRRNIINGQLTTGQRVRNGIKGQADAYALIHGGLHVEIEAKSARGTLTPEQRNWQSFCAKFDIPHIVLAARINESPDATVERWTDELSACIAARSARLRA